MFVAVHVGDIEVLLSHERTLWFGIPQDFSQNRCHLKNILCQVKGEGLLQVLLSYK